MTHTVARQMIENIETDTVCRRASLALLALRTKYGLETVDIGAMDRITALRVAATFDFLHNNLPETL